MRLSWSICCGLLGITIASTAGAQAVALAESHFNRGLADMLAGRYETGCPALAESHRLDPRPGRLFTLAECEAKWGRIAAAVARYNDYLALYSRLPASEQALQAERRRIAQEQRDALAPLVPQLTLVLPPDAPPGTIVQRDGITLQRPSLGVALPVDPGEHVVTTQAPSGPVTEIRFTIERSESKTIELEVKLPPPPESQSAALSATAQPVSIAPLATRSTAPVLPEDRGSGRRALVYVTGGLGAAGLIAGAVTGALALNASSVADDHCVDVRPGVARCDDSGKDAGDRAKTLGLVSTIGFGAGAALAGTAVLLLLTEPSPRQQSPDAVSFSLLAEPDGGGVVMRSRW